MISSFLLFYVGFNAFLSHCNKTWFKFVIYAGFAQNCCLQIYSFPKLWSSLLQICCVKPINIVLKSIFFFSEQTSLFKILISWLYYHHLLSFWFKCQLVAVLGWLFLVKIPLIFQEGFLLTVHLICKVVLYFLLWFRLFAFWHPSSAVLLHFLFFSDLLQI